MSADKCDEHSRIVGTKQLIKYMEQDRVDQVILARDAEPHVTDRVLALAQERGVTVKYVETMEELGRSCGIAVGAAAAGLLKKA